MGPDTDVLCHDGIDNDQDGDADCDDSCCAVCSEDDAITFYDSADNDLDGDIDCADADCVSSGTPGSPNDCSLCSSASPTPATRPLIHIPHTLRARRSGREKALQTLRTS